MVKPRTKILASFLLVFLALALMQTIDSSIQIHTNEQGTFETGSSFEVYATKLMDKPFGVIGLNGTLRFWNGTVGTHEGALQKWPMYWFISTDLWIRIKNETFFGGCLVIPNYEQAYGWREIAVRDAKAVGMKIIVIESFEQLAIICWAVDRTLLIKLYLSKAWIISQEKQSALDYFNQRWQTNYTIEEILANSASPWT